MTGHVTLEDTGGPARFASVTLIPVATNSAPAPANANPSPDQLPIIVSRVFHTTLDGSFLVPDVAPGNYYVMVDAPAYLSASGLLTRQQLDHPTKEIARQIEQLLVPVAVASGKISTADVRLHRGASLSGNVQFDDGTPFSTFVSLFRKDPKGEWQRFNAHLGGTAGITDALGHFHLLGLPAGAYRVSIELGVDEDFISQQGGEQQGWASSPIYALRIYSPSATREKDAKTFQLTEDQEEAGVQIEVPLSKLHAVTGSLVEKGSGRSINAGHVAVLFADDGKELGSTNVNGDDSSFHLAFVPEGSYTLEVSNVQNVERTRVPNEPGSIPPYTVKERSLQGFGDASQPLVVTTDVQGILIAVPPQAQTSNTSATTAQATNPISEDH